MTDKPADRLEQPEPDTPEPADENTPGSPNWVPRQPDKRIDRGRGPTCPYRLGF